MDVAIPRRLRSPNMLEGWTRSVAMDVTYITTSYRDAEYLKACNRSVLGQIGIEAKHIIIIDGYNTDVLKNFERDKRTAVERILLKI